MSIGAPADGVVVCRLPASVDDAWIERVGAYLRALAVQPNVHVLSFDAAELRSINARGVGLLTALRLMAAERGATVTIRHCRASLSGLLDAARLDLPGHDGPAAPGRNGRPVIDPPAWWMAAASNA